MQKRSIFQNVVMKVDGVLKSQKKAKELFTLVASSGNLEFLDYAESDI